MSGGAAAERSGGGSVPSAFPLPPSFLSFPLPPPPALRCQQGLLPGALQRPQVSRPGAREEEGSQATPLPTAPNVRWGWELACARAGSRVGKAGARGTQRKGREDWGAAGVAGELWDRVALQGKSCSRGGTCTGSGGLEFREDVAVRGLGRRRRREPKNWPGSLPEVLPQGFGESAQPRCA